MMTLHWRARLYWGGIVGTALGLFALTLLGGGHLEVARPPLAVAFAGLVVLVKRFPLHMALKTKVTLDTTVLFAAILLFEPMVAMALAGAGTLVAQLVGRKGWLQGLFNSAQAMLRVGIGALVLAGAGWDTTHLSFGQPIQLVMLAVAAGAIYMIDTLATATMVALQTDRAPLRVWRQTVALTATEEMAQLALGLLAAAVVDVHPWALPLFALPALAIYHSLERHARLRRQTLQAVEALAGIVDIRDRDTAAYSRRMATFARELAGSPDTPAA